MSVPTLHSATCWLMLVITPASVMASDGAAVAIVSGKGSVLLNGNLLPDSSAINAGDSVQTTVESMATITGSGVSVIVQPESLLKFVAPNSISLEQGAISVATSTGIVTSAGMASATPASNVWTEYEVTNANGGVEIHVRKGTLNVNCGKETATLPEGEHIGSDPSGKCSRDRRRAGAYPSASGDILSSPYWKYIAAAAGTGILIWLLWPNPKQPVSASQP
jgi:hypothetical protein